MNQGIGNVSDNSGMKFVYTAIGGEKKVFILNQGTPKAIIGRNYDCEMLTDCPSVSRHHAVLIWENGHVYVMFPPTGPATNGLYVNGMSLQTNVRLEVVAGSRLSVGGFIADAYAVDSGLNPTEGTDLDPNEGVVFFWRYGQEDILSFWMNSRNRLAVIGSRSDCEVCIPGGMEKVSPHHAVLVWLSAMDRDRVYIDRHPACQLSHVTILSSGSMYEKKLDNGLHGVYPECVIRIGDVEIFAFYPDHAFKLLGDQAKKNQGKHGTAKEIDEIMAEVHEQMRLQDERDRNRSLMMVGYGPPPVYNGPVGVFAAAPQAVAPAPQAPQPCPTSENKSFCAVCGAPVEKDAPFCGNCGALRQ